MADPRPVVQLNNIYQANGRSAFLEYFAIDNGPSSPARWTVIYKDSGRILGQATAPNLATAKNQAAAMALASLGAS
ncbi:hypothetical protein OF83DRAFT_1169407 [Amylostereum chailletii]|nr:hypothetical protein OF83DRAFT_1169407 [Amylostereum chailletii]